MIVINFKTYRHVLGKRGLETAKAILREGRKAGVPSLVAPAVFDLVLYKGMEALAQRIDPIHEGRGTGKVPADIVRDYGLRGAILNHSENRMRKKEIRECVEMLREMGKMSIVCAGTPKEARRLARMNPDFIAFEPPSLIAGNVSVSEAEPDEIAEALSSVPLLVGAGIHSPRDVEKAIMLGASGVLVSSYVANSRDPVSRFLNLAKGFKRGHARK